MKNKKYLSILLASSVILTGCGNSGIEKMSQEDVENKREEIVSQSEIKIENKVSDSKIQNTGIAFFSSDDGMISAVLDYDGKFTIFGQGPFDCESTGTLETTSQEELSNTNIAYMISDDGKIHCKFSLLGEIYGDKIISLQIEEGITEITSSSGLLSITSVSFPSSMKKIGEKVFRDCETLQTVDFSNGLTEIGDSAFESCSSLTNVTLPESLKVIGKWAFNRCTSLKNVSLSECNATIKQGAFSTCPNLSELYIPDSCKIEELDSNTGYELLIVDQNTTLLANKNSAAAKYAANHNLNIKILDDNNDLNEMDKTNVINIYSKDDKYKTIYKNFLNTADLSLYERFDFYDIDKDGVPELFLSEGVFHAAQVDVFTVSSNGTVIQIADNCGSYGLVSIKETYIFIDTWMEKKGNQFVECSYDVQQDIKNGDDEYNSIGDKYLFIFDDIQIVLDKYGKTDVYQSTDSSLSDLHTMHLEDNSDSLVPDQTETNLSYDWINQLSETPPEELKYYYDAAVKGICIHGVNRNDRASYNIVIPQVIDGHSIADVTLFNDEHIKQLVLPEGLTHIKNNAFYGCSSMEKIYIPESVTSIGEGAFEGCQSLEEVKLPPNITEINNNAFSACGKLTSMDIPNGVTYIGSEAFRHDRYLNEITLPDSITVIDKDAFSETGITSLILPPKTITFEGMSSEHLESIYLPDGLKKLGYLRCPNLNEIEIPDSVTEFKGLKSSNIKYLIWPSGCEEIPERALSDCSALEEVILPDGLKSIKTEAFSGCEKLYILNIPDSVTYIQEGAFDNNKSITVVYKGKEYNYTNFSEIYSSGLYS